MVRNYMRAKIHAATVTETILDYEGSIAIDASILEAAEIYPYEQLHVYNITNGNRFVTYAIEAKRGSGSISLNGAAAHLASPGDKVIIVSYCALEDKERESFQGKVLLMGEENQIKDSFYVRPQLSLGEKLENKELS